jgi:hypothetical protein
VDVIRDKEHMNTRVEESKKQLLAMRTRHAAVHGSGAPSRLPSLTELTAALRDAAELLELPTRNLGAFLPLTHVPKSDGKKGGAGKGGAGKASARGKKKAGAKQTRASKRTLPPPPQEHDSSAGAAAPPEAMPGYMVGILAAPGGGMKRNPLPSGPAAAPASGSEERSTDEGGAGALVPHSRGGKRRAGAWRAARARAACDLLGLPACTRHIAQPAVLSTAC